VVLNKTDLTEDVDLRIRQVEGIAIGIPVLPMSAAMGTGVSALLDHLGQGRTGVFLGSSGVGKSSLTNRLIEEERLDTRTVRESDGRGRHATTRRELILLPAGRGLVIDTPGLREIQLWAGEEDLDRGFADVAELAAGCRFRDCRHAGEPGCAVQQALGNGTLDPARYESSQDHGLSTEGTEAPRAGALRSEATRTWNGVRMSTRTSNRAAPEAREGHLPASGRGPGRRVLPFVRSGFDHDTQRPTAPRGADIDGP
jgi:ribosome biogenesis GTPase